MNEPANPSSPSETPELAPLQYWKSPHSPDRRPIAPLEPITFGQWIAYTIFSCLTGALFLFSILWFSAAAMRMH